MLTVNRHNNRETVLPLVVPLAKNIERGAVLCLRRNLCCSEKERDSAVSLSVFMYWASVAIIKRSVAVSKRGAVLSLCHAVSV